MNNYQNLVLASSLIWAHQLISRVFSNFLFLPLQRWQRGTSPPEWLISVDANPITSRHVPIDMIYSLFWSLSCAAYPFTRQYPLLLITLSSNTAHEQLCCTKNYNQANVLLFLSHSQNNCFNGVSRPQPLLPWWEFWTVLRAFILVIIMRGCSPLMDHRSTPLRSSRSEWTPSIHPDEKLIVYLLNFRFSWTHNAFSSVL